jgi:hypothetical protein
VCFTIFVCADVAAAAATLRLVAAGPLGLPFPWFSGYLILSFSTILSSVAGELWNF